MFDDDMKLSKQITRTLKSNGIYMYSTIDRDPTTHIQTQKETQERKDMYPNDLLNDLLKEREKTHGDFFCNSLYSQSLKMIMKSSKNWDGLSEFKKESLEMIVHKIGRILAGDSNCEDHWDDIAGYSKLVSNKIAQDKIVSDPTHGRAWCEKKETV